MLVRLSKEHEGEIIQRQFERLVGPDEMGENFKFLYVTKKDLDLVYPFIDPILNELKENKN